MNDSKPKRRWFWLRRISLVLGVLSLAAAAVGYWWIPGEGFTQQIGSILMGGIALILVALFEGR
jgi:hypothetical protein